MRTHKRGSSGVGRRDRPDGWAALRSTRSGPYVNRLRRATSFIFGGNKVELLTSAPVIICGASIVILSDAGRRGGGAVFTSAFDSFGFWPS